MTRPAIADNTATRVLGAIIDAHADHRRPTIRDVADRLNLARSTVYSAILRLSAAGLVAHDGPGTLRPTVTITAANPAPWD